MSQESSSLPPGMPETEPKTAAELTDTEQASLAGTSEETIVQTAETVIPDEEQHYVRIDKRNLAKEIDRLMSEDKDFAQVFSSKVGNKAARQYKPQIDELTRTAAEAQKNAFIYWAKALPEDERNQRFQSDPNFAKAYTELIIHTNPQAAAAENEQARRNKIVNTILFNAQDKGVSEDRIKQFIADIPVKYNAGSFEEALDAFNRDITDAIVEARMSSYQPPVQQAAVQTETPAANGNGLTAQPAAGNPKLLQGSANSGSASSRSGAGHKYTKAEIENIQNTNPAKFYKLFPGDSDFEDAIRRGEIEGMSLTNR